MKLHGMFLAVCLCIGAFATARAQLVPDGGYAAISGVATNLIGNLVVGTNGSFTALLIANSGAVTNTGNGVIGQNSAAFTNEVLVTGAGSVWAIGGNLNFGVLGSYNRLIVSDGGRVENSFGNMAFNGGSGNSARVTDPGSVWTNRQNLNVGNTGSFNLLTVTNQGTVECGSSLNLGNSGASNQLWAADGATLRSGSGAIGVSPNSRGNLAVLTGPDTTWSANGPLSVGLNGSFNQLHATNGVRISSVGAYVGGNFAQSAGGSSNVVLLAGASSTWTNTSTSSIGNFGSYNELTIADGAVLRTAAFFGSLVLGWQPSGSNNTLRLTGTNSRFSNRDNAARLSVGQSSPFNRLLIEAGAVAETDTGAIGENAGASNNVALIADPGSTWFNTVDLLVGNNGPASTLIISNNATVATRNLTIGLGASSVGNILKVLNSQLVGTGAAGAIEILRVGGAGGGQLSLDGGLIVADLLLLTNGTLSELGFSSGQIDVHSLQVNNTLPLLIGDGLSPAVLNLVSNGTHSVPDGLTIRNQGRLIGQGTISGTVTVEVGGELAPGASVGRLVLSNSPALNGTVIMELGKNGAILTNDQLQVEAGLDYGGSLEIAHLGPTALVAGDNFKLFQASSYGGAFDNVALPNPGPGLSWTNKLLVDGSIEVIQKPIPILDGVIILSGTNLVFQVSNGEPNGAYEVLTSTDVTLPLGDWATIGSGNFDGVGQVSITNAINLAEPERYFRVRQF